MKILISGAHGLVGSALCEKLKKEGHVLYYLVRRAARAEKNEIYWNADGGSLDRSALDGTGIEAVIHLAGESIAAGRWNENRKRKIRDSRINGTRILAEAIANLSNPPKVLIAASAVGYYGTRGDEELTESSAAGTNFLAEVCEAWEAACKPAVDKGIRVVNLRFGVVLSGEGGILKKTILPYKLGLGGVLGNGRQYMSWIDFDDVLGVIQFALSTDKLAGPVNACSPQPVTNREYTKTVGRVLFRPTLFSMPASTARMVFGEMADELLLASERAFPKKLQAAGYAFQFPDLKSSLKHQLKK